MPAPVLRISLPDRTLGLVAKVAKREKWTESHALGMLVTEALRARGHQVEEPVLSRGGRPKKPKKPVDRLSSVR